MILKLLFFFLLLKVVQLTIPMLISVHFVSNSTCLIYKKVTLACEIYSQSEEIPLLTVLTKVFLCLNCLTPNTF